MISKFNIFKGREGGVILIETLAALAILGLVAVGFLSGLATSTEATVIADERAIAESLVRGEIEYVKNCAYQYFTSEYPVNPVLAIPEGCSLPPPVVEPVHETDDGIQHVKVLTKHDGETILSVCFYKVDR